MNARTKVILALVALFVGMMAIYYGVIYPSGSDDPLASTDPLAAGGAGAEGREATEATSDLLALGRPDRSTPRDALPSPEAGESGWTARNPLDIDAAGLGSLGRDTSGSDTLSASLPVSDPFAGLAPPRSDATSGPTADPDLPLSTVPSAEPARTAAAPAGPSKPADTRYTIKRRDTMSSIALEWLGDAELWPLIAQANPRVDPIRLKIGATILLPPRDGAASARPAQPASARDERIHVVRTGETLTRVAMTYYGDDRKWRAIYTANRGMIGSDPDQLEVGMRLVIPEA